MYKSLLLLLSASLFAPFCKSNHCSDLGTRYSAIRSEFEKINTQKPENQAVSHERRLKKLLERAQVMEIDFDGCDIGKDDDILDKLGAMIDSEKVSQLKNEIERSLSSGPLPNEWDIRSAINDIEDNLQDLYPHIKIDEAGNVEMQGHRFYIESVRAEVVDSGIAIACIRDEQCISDNLTATGIPIDHMKAQRIVEYLTDYKAVIVCKHSKTNCAEILKKYKN